MSKIDDAIEYVTTELAYAKNPGTYMDEEYYIRCSAKADILDDVLYRLIQLRDDPDSSSND